MQTLDSHPRLARRWAELVGPVAGATAAGAYLLGAYAAAGRHYHNLRHLEEMLAAVDDLSSYADDPTAVELAAWFHDAVYDPRRADNEERSARLAEDLLGALSTPPERVVEVARLVRLTATHAPAPEDRNGAVLCDADLAVLAADATRYRGYADAVRREYAHVRDADFALGRAVVLRSLLALPTLYRTPGAVERCEQAARANVSAELNALSHREADAAPTLPGG